MLQTDVRQTSKVFGGTANLQILCSVKETYGRGSKCTEDRREGRIGATKYAGGDGTRKRGGKAERITQG